MAIGATIYKATVAVADIDHSYYAEHALTLARHPSETDERMMMRLVALSLHAFELEATCNGDADLSFGAGLSNPDEPDVWLRDFTGRIRLWIEVGQPDERALTKACSKADRVIVVCYQNASPIWWQGLQNKVSRLDRLEVWAIDPAAAQSLSRWAQRSMQLQATMQDGSLMMSGEGQVLSLETRRLK
jgi:uncharacterized protein YaeQ